MKIDINMLIVRLMTIDDYDDVYRLWTITEGMALRSYDDSREGIEKFLKKNPTSNFVAVYDGRIVGVILCGIDGRRAYIYHTVVDKEFRCQGIGKKLLDEVIKVSEIEGIKKNGLLVKGDNELGKHFWKSQGWDERNDVIYYSKNNVEQ